MKLLIAYDGSECADQLFDDMLRAGLPDTCEALVLTISGEEPFEGSISLLTEPSMHELVQAAKDSAAAMNDRAVEHLRKDHPNWDVRGEIRSGSVATAILERSKTWPADLIEIASHGRGLVGRMFLGSVSMSVLHRAHCTVRIARGHQAKPNHPDANLRILLAYDGSDCSKLAFDAMLAREWATGTTLRIISVVEPMISSSYGYGGLGSDLVMSEAEDEQHRWLGEQLGELKLRAQSVFASVEAHSTFGLARQIIIEEAKTWHADTIFMGAHGRSPLMRVAIGSVSQNIAMHAPCTVEIVR
jgi:nucleotide-binding universal stress UspA family protein